MIKILFSGIALFAVGFVYSFLSFKNSGSKVYIMGMGLSSLLLIILLYIALDIFKLGTSYDF